MIAAKVANARALDYPRELLELIVACDGSPDATAERARDAGADLVLELPRGGKIRAQDAAVERARGEIVAFSDANALLGAATRCARSSRRSPTRASATSAARCASRDPTAGTQPGGRCTGATRWRCARSESRLARVTGGNGAIYATRRDAYIVVDPVMGHDLSFPFNMVKRGLARASTRRRRAASEKMVPSIEGEFARKRRMMSHAWPIVAARRPAVAARATRRSTR